MNVITRAALSLRSRPGRTLLMLLTFLVISVMVLSGVLIRDAAAQAGREARERVGAEVALELDMDALVSGGQLTAPRIGAETVDRIGGSPLVEKYTYRSFDGTRLLGGHSTVGDGFGDGHTLVHGVLDSSLLPDFSSGTWRLLSGAPITAGDQDRNVILIEERLARHNQLAVGDSLTLTENDPAGDNQADFTVQGIFRNPSDEPDPEYWQEPGDWLIIPARALSRLNSGGDDVPVQVGSATFQLKDPATFDAFTAMARETAGAELDGFALTVNDKAIQQMTGPLRGITSSATAAMWLIGGAGAVVLGLFTALTVKGRRRECGILLAMGERKGKLIAQQTLEIVVVAAFAIALSAVLTERVTQWAGDALLRREVTAAHEEIDAWQAPAPGSTGLAEGIDPLDAPVENADPIDTITVRLDPSAVGALAGVGLGIGLLAAAVPATAVLRLTPRTILTKGI
ncbi:hypothetical protein SUDANB171_03251 [Streptomyces sp. enrichment culture]|uniref:ABC transporter permease n=1 Tax=Streptomyces sp. enrichment culture TaxID=1795815 RepID=UPI003F56985F